MGAEIRLTVRKHALVSAIIPSSTAAPARSLTDRPDRIPDRPARQLPEGFSHFVTSMTAPVASGWSDRRVGLAPTGKRRLTTAHTLSGHRAP